MDAYKKKLSPYEYFLQLQVEYVAIAIRAKIFYKNKNKLYWEDIRDKKKAQIEILAANNNLRTIFSDPELRSSVEEIFYKDGQPNFTYRDHANEHKQKPFDLLAYYQAGEEVSYSSKEGEQGVGKIKKYKLNSESIEIVDKDKLVIAPIKETKRILFNIYPDYDV